jgi:transposase
MEKPAELPLSDSDWIQTPPAAQSLLVTLWMTVQQLSDQVSALQAEVTTLREQLGQTSRNSSRPPSSDPPWAEKGKKKKRGKRRKRGGQPGHAGHGRKLLPVEQVDEVVPVKPSVCAHCQAMLDGDDAHPRRHQVTELPEVKARVTEYQLHTLRCGHCDLLTEAAWPEGVPSSAFGPRVHALVGLLSGAYRLSKRQIRSLLSDGFGVEISTGSVSGLEQVVSEGIAAPVAQARTHVQEQPAANLDETRWSEANRTAWLWTMVTRWVTVFVIRFSRGSKVVRTLLGPEYEGIVGSDRYSSYAFLPVHQRQLCWAHLHRDFQAMIDRGGESARMGTALLAQADLMFTWWHRVRDGTMKRHTFRSYMVAVRLQVHQDLERGTRCVQSNTAATCRELLKVEPALWTFVHREGVEPTNNAAEQALRQGVLWRKSSFGTQSETGTRFVERILTVVTTLRQQKRNVLEFLTAACLAYGQDTPTPSLLPTRKRTTPTF